MKNHFPVMATEVIELFLPIVDGGIYVDATFGAGGYTKELLSKNSDLTIICIDRDLNCEQYIDICSKQYPKAKIIFENSLFSDIDNVLKKHNIEKVDGIMLDAGVSSMQFDNAVYGFSFNKSGALKMQMGLNNISAYDVVNHYSEKELSSIIYKYGNERFAKRISRAIVNERKKELINDTLIFAEIIKKAVPFYNDSIHPATRTFQAIRIEVNKELRELEIILEKSLTCLKSDGLMSVVTFHSLEDSIVKHFIKKFSQNKSINRHDPALMLNISDKKIISITKKPILPSEKETSINPRSRSAKLRSFRML